MALGREQFALWYMNRREDEKVYIDELLVHYQTVLDTATTKLDMAEALHKDMLDYKKAILEDDYRTDYNVSDAKSVLSRIMAM